MGSLALTEGGTLSQSARACWVWAELGANFALSSVGGQPEQGLLRLMTEHGFLGPIAIEERWLARGWQPT